MAPLSSFAPTHTPISGGASSTRASSPSIGLRERQWRDRRSAGRDQVHRTNAWQMVGRRARAAGITTEVCNHTLRGMGITAYLENGGTLEKARQMAAHASTRTTQLYDRREDRVMLDEVVNINLRG